MNMKGRIACDWPASYSPPLIDGAGCHLMSRRCRKWITVTMIARGTASLKITIPTMTATPNNHSMFPSLARPEPACRNLRRLLGSRHDMLWMCGTAYGLYYITKSAISQYLFGPF